MGAWLCMSVKNLQIYGNSKREETQWGSLKLYTSVVWGEEESRALQLRSDHSSILLFANLASRWRKDKNLSATQTSWRLYTGRGVCAFCAPSEVFPPRIAEPSPWGETAIPAARRDLAASALRKQRPSSALTQRVVQEPLCGSVPIHGRKWGK